MVINGPKHNTATYIIRSEKENEDLFLDFIDLSFHLALTANDNHHRLNYSQQKMSKFLNEVINLAYNFRQITYHEDCEDFHNELLKIWKKYYKHILKRKNYSLYTELPNRPTETPPENTLSTFDELWGRITGGTSND